MGRVLGVRAKVVVAGAGVAVAGALFGVQPACELQGSCDSSVEPPQGAPAPTGELIDENNWESGPIDGNYIDFPGQRSQAFDLSLLGFNRPLANITTYLSPDRNWVEAGSNFTSSAGNLTEVTAIYPLYAGPSVDGGIQHGQKTNAIVVYNATCAPYFLRVTVQAFPLDAGAPPGAPVVSTVVRPR